MLLPMPPRARISKEQHDALIVAFRERPGVALYAGQQAGVTYRTAKRAWEQGWPNPPWARPIRDIFADEERSARAILASEQAVAAKESAVVREERRLARIDAAMERSREAEGVRAAMSNALSLLANLGAFSRASVATSKAAAEQLLEEVQEKKVHWSQAVVFLGKLSLIGERATTQLQTTMQAIRLHLGEPEKYVGLSITADQPTTQVDGKTAVQVLGEDRLRQAVIDLATGKITEDVERLMEWQVEQPARLPVRAGEGQA